MIPNLDSCLVPPGSERVTDERNVLRDAEGEEEEEGQHAGFPRAKDDAQQPGDWEGGGDSIDRTSAERSPKAEALNEPVPTTSLTSTLEF